MYNLARTNRAKRDLNLGAIVRLRQLTVTYVGLTDADQQQDFDVGAALPAGAFVLGSFLDVTVAFQNVGDTDTTTADLGVKSGDVDSLIDGADLGTIAKTDATIGAKPQGYYGGSTLQLRVDSDVNLDTLTAGSVTVNVFYVDTDDVQVAS